MSTSSKIAKIAGIVLAAAIAGASQRILDGITGLLGIPHLPVADSFAEHLADTGEKLYHNL